MAKGARRASRRRGVNRERGDERDHEWRRRREVESVGGGGFRWRGSVVCMKGEGERERNRWDFPSAVEEGGRQNREEEEEEWRQVEGRFERRLRFV